MLTHAPKEVWRTWIVDSRRWDTYKPRPGDVVVATAPKVGTTWTQQIVSLLIFQSAEPRAIQEVSPWIDVRLRMPVEPLMEMIEAQTHRRSLKSHLPFDAMPIYDEVKYIHVARDGRDACMSFLNHTSAYTDGMWELADKAGLEDETIGRTAPRPPKAAREFYHYWMSNGGDQADRFTADDFFHLERSYWEHRHDANVLLVHYNDLKADLSGEMARIAAFLDIETPPALWPSLVEAATFETMKSNGAALLPEIDRAFKGGHDTFLNKGSNDRWRDVLTGEDVDLYKDRAAKELSPALSAWLEHGRLKTCDPRQAAD